jgi:hypothetical protein
MAKKFDPKAKAKRQKIVAAVLGVLFLGVMVYQAPTILGLFGGGSSKVETEPAPPPPPSATPTSPAPATATPAAATPGAGTAALVDSDPAAPATQGQLVTFDRFDSKDPFAQQAEKGPETGGAPSSAPRVAGKPPTGVAEPQPAPQPTPAPRGRASTAKISVNGVATNVATGGTFPQDEPVFKLVSVTKNSAKVGIVGGTYATGSQTITLKRGGKPVTLMNTADGTTYVLRLLSVS